MHDPFDLIPWAIGIGVAWMILISLTGLDDWLKHIFGKKGSGEELEERVETLEKRIQELEKKP